MEAVNRLARRFSNRAALTMIGMYRKEKRLSMPPDTKIKKSCRRHIESDLEVGKLLYPANTLKRHRGDETENEKDA